MQDNFARAQPQGQTRARRYQIWYLVYKVGVRDNVGIRVTVGLGLRLGILVGLARKIPCLAQLS